MTYKYSVDTIEKELHATIGKYKGRRGTTSVGKFSIQNLRNYSTKVLFLIKTIRRLEKRLK